MSFLQEPALASITNGTLLEKKKVDGSATFNHQTSHAVTPLLHEDLQHDYAMELEHLQGKEKFSIPTCFCYDFTRNQVCVR